MIPISSVQFGQEEEDLVLEVLRSGLIAQGPMVARLESQFAEQFGHSHAIAVNNGTTALVAALEVLDLKPGDEVITTPFTFVATLNAILEAGATAVFADINEDDFNVNPESMAAMVNPRTKVLMPVHLYGQMADMAPIAELATHHNLAIVEDSAQSHGATYEGRGAGSYGIGTFSLYATKNITTGEGGLIVTGDDGLADRLRVLRNQGMRERYVYEVAGHNYRLTDLQAAVGIPQLGRYAATVRNRKANAAALIAGLEGLAGLVTPRELPGRSHVWHQFTVRITDDFPLTRDQLVARLNESGVGAGIYYPKLVTDYDAYRRHPRVRVSNTPTAEAVSNQALSLPVHNRLSEEDISKIVSVIRGIAE